MMLTEQQLIGRLKDLRQVKPRQDWVVSVKSQILGEEEPKSFSVFQFLFSYKPAFAGLVAVMAIIGVFGFSQKSLPGDVLYVVKKAIEKTQIAFLPEEQAPAFDLKLANARLEDLAKATGKNLAPTINEFQASISSAARRISQMDATSSDPSVIKKIVEETIKMRENKQKVESLGMVVEGDQINDFDKAVVEYLISDLEGRTLTLEQTLILSEIKNLYQERRYSEALESYLVNQ